MAIESGISQLYHRECYIIILEAVSSVDRERQVKSHGYIFREGRDSEARMIVITHLGEIINLAPFRVGYRSFNSTW